MSKIQYEYIVVSKIDKNVVGISKKLRPILSELEVGDTVTVKSLFSKHKDILGFKNDRYVINDITHALKVACESKKIQRTNNATIPQWFKSLDTVSFWTSQLRGSKFKNQNKISTSINSTQLQYLHHLWKFNRWISEKAFAINMLQTTSDNTFVQKTEQKKFENVESLLKLLEQPFADQKNVTRIIKQYLLDEMHSHKKATYMNLIKSAIVSYFEKNEYLLQVNYNPKTSHSTELEEQDMTISDLMKFLTIGKPSITEHAVFLCKFHRGLDVSTLVDRFNYEAWPQMAKWFGSENHDSWDLEKCPVPITLTRIKTDYKHVGFLERDAVDILQKYLDFRKEKTGNSMQDDQPLFLTKFQKPISPRWVFTKFSRIAQRSGVQKFVETNGRKQYRMDSHDLRDLLKSTLIDSGCRIDVADHVIGHKPKDSYGKQAKLYPETLRKEYAKASQRLNLFTKFTSVTSGKDDADELKLELREKISEIGRLKEDLLTELAIKKREDMFRERQSEMLRQMQRQIDELSGKSSGNIAKSVEFCCISCSTVHDRQKCPACGSKLKRIYESGTEKV